VIHPWLADTWQRLIALGERMPHALLFVGPPGVGKRDIAEALAARLLCRAPRADGHACGECDGCTLRLSGNHPDLMRVEPPDAVADDEAEPDSKGRKSSQIVIDQIRDVQEALTVTGHQSARRVVLVDPAEAMNTFTANALLKLLEEPPADCVLVLVSSSPRRLLPTIRSRCQQWPFSRPVPEQVAARGGDATLLAVSGGLPLAAERLAAKGGGEQLQRFVRDVSRLPESDPLALAAQWEIWLRGKDAAATGLDIVLLTDWMQRWVCDLAAVSMGGRLRFFPEQQQLLAKLATRAGVAAASNCYNEFARIRRVAQHPLNMRLMLEDMLLRYARVVSGAGS
jgi:DNA polymerase III subunit delta'